MFVSRRLSCVLEDGLHAERVDLARGIVYGAKIGGLYSLHNRDYTDETYQRSASAYEGAVGYRNHAGGPSGRKRNVEDAFCVYHNPRPVPGEGLRADVHVIDPEDPFSRMFLKAAASDDPAKHNAFSFSHDAQIRSRAGKSGRQVVESIDKVQSVDVVARGATTRGIFEGDDMVEQLDKDEGPDYGEHLCNAAHAVMSHPKIHPKEKLRKIHGMLKVKYGSGLDGSGAADESPDMAPEPEEKPSDKPGKKRGGKDKDEDLFDSEADDMGGSIGKKTKESADEEDQEKAELKAKLAASEVKEWVREQADTLGIKVAPELMAQCVQESAEPLKVAALLNAEVAKQQRKKTALPKSVGYATTAVQESKDERPKDTRASLARWAPGALRRSERAQAE